MDHELRTWRIHVDVRCAVDLPFQESRGEERLPSTFIEVGWTAYSERAPDADRKQSTRTVEEECNPAFNERFVVEPPPSVHERDGYLFVGLQYEERYDSEDRGVFIPLNIMSVYVPYHFVRSAQPASLHCLALRRLQGQRRAHLLRLARGAVRGELPGQPRRGRLLPAAHGAAALQSHLGHAAHDARLPRAQRRTARSPSCPSSSTTPRRQTTSRRKCSSTP